jgi:predicted PurR-regulated permease PerM
MLTNVQPQSSFSWRSALVVLLALVGLIAVAYSISSSSTATSSSAAASNLQQLTANLVDEYQPLPVSQEELDAVWHDASSTSASPISLQSTDYGGSVGTTNYGGSVGTTSYGGSVGPTDYTGTTA